ncbi:RsiV family protein [Fibrobacter sp.]
MLDWKRTSGWHFVYSPYEIAPFAAGVIEVIIPRK